MKRIIELYQRLNSEKDFNKRYPEYKQSDDKIHVLYVGPCLNATGLYRMILPALELNRTRTHAAIISNIHKWDFTKSFDDYNNPVDSRLVEWANYIVLPAMLTGVSYIMEAFLKKNKALEFVMDIDCLYHAIPQTHPAFNKTGRKEKAILLANLAKMDYVTAPSEMLLDYYERLIEKQYSDAHVFLDCLPNLLSNYIYEDIKDIYKNSTGTARIGLIMNASQVHDLETVEQVLKHITEKYKENVELIVFGRNDRNNNTFLKDLPVTWQKSVPITEYFETLNNLMFDIALVPLKDIPFNTRGKSFQKYLELAAFHVPVVTSNVSPFKQVIKDGENGFLAKMDEEWISNLEKLIEHKDYREEVGYEAWKHTWGNYSYTRKNLAPFQHLFNG